MKKQFEIKFGEKKIVIYNYYIFFSFALLLALYILSLVIIYSFKFYKLHKKTESTSKNLEKINFYGKSNKEFESIFDLVKGYDTIWREKYKIKKKFEKYQSAYKYFLKYLYLPSLNIWTDPYTEKVDLTLIGPKFIEKNPFIDTNLISKRTSFFKHVGFSKGKFPPNDIKNLKVGKVLVDKKRGIFYIPISVELITSNRKTFIALVNKLSLTANKKNIALINEFFYHLFNEIKVEQEKQGKKIDYKEIGQTFYYWINDKIKDNPLLTPSAFYNTIRDIVGCNSKYKQECYSLFRKEYESLPFFVYMLGAPDDVNSFNKKKEFLKAFLKEFPPLIEIRSFVFNKTTDSYLGNFGEEQFVVQINFDIYGRNITDKEVNHISQVLAMACFGTGGKNNPKQLNFRIAYNIVNDVLVKTSEKKIKSITIYNYKEILNYLNGFIKQEKTYNNYEKTIKLFETYRILKANGFCKNK